MPGMKPGMTIAMQGTKLPLTPAKAGVQCSTAGPDYFALDPRVRGDERTRSVGAPLYVAQHVPAK
jgi:hypothetical protein